MSKTKKKEFVRTQLDFETREEDKGVRRAARQTRAALKSSELGFIRERLATSVSANISRAADHVAAAGPAAMPQAAFDDFTRKVQGVARAAELDERLAGIQRRFEKRAKAPKVKVSSEPRVYGKSLLTRISRTWRPRWSRLAMRVRLMRRSGWPGMTASWRLRFAAGRKRVSACSV